MRSSLAGKIALGATLLVLLSVALGTMDAYLSVRGELRALLGERLAGAARLAAALVRPEDHRVIQTNADVELPEFERVRDALVQAQQSYELESPLHTLRLSAAEGRVEAVVMTDCDAPYVGRQLPLREDMLITLYGGQVTYTPPYEDAQGHWISAYAPIWEVDGTIAAAVEAKYPIDAYFRALNRRMFWVLLFSASVGLLGGALGFGYARRITRPLLRLVEATEDVNRGDYDVRVPVHGRDEVATLGAAFNTMVEGLRERDRVKSVFGKYIPHAVADRLMAHSDVLRVQGERREVSVLITDIRDYAAFAEGQDPEIVVRALNDYFAVLIDVLFAHEGTIDKFMGDALLAYFGAPLQQDDHRRRAVDAALDIQRELKTFNAARRADGLPPLETGIGLADGDVLLGNLGTHKRLEYTIIGEAVNLASRLCAEAPGGRIYAAESMLHGMEDAYITTELPAIGVKGFTAAVPVLDVQGPAA